MMRKVCVVLFVGVFGLLAWPAHAQWCPGYVDLIAAQHYDVGDVNVSHDTETVTVEYVVTEPGYCLTETHLYLDPERPSKTAPGQFPWGDDELGCVTGYTENIPWANLGGQQPVWVAAHAVVCGAGADYTELELALDYEAQNSGGEVKVSLSRPGTSYWRMTFLEGPNLSGQAFDGWCADVGRAINEGLHEMDLIPTYVVVNGVVQINPVIDTSLVDRPENLDLVNWIINQGFAGAEAPGDLGIFTWSDIQRAIWELLDNATDPRTGLGSWSQARVDIIREAALLNGEGFLPTCGQVVAVLLVDDSGSYQTTIFQVTFFELGLPCVPTGMCETAWGAGEQIRPGKNWAMTFRYEECPAP